MDDLDLDLGEFAHKSLIIIVGLHMRVFALCEPSAFLQVHGLCSKEEKGNGRGNLGWWGLVFGLIFEFHTS